MIEGLKRYFLEIKRIGGIFFILNFDLMILKLIKVLKN